MNIETILCPTDLSIEADEALRYALALALSYDAKLILLYCREPGSVVEWSTSSRAAHVFEQSLFTRLDAREFKSLNWEPAIVDTHDVGNGIVAEAAKKNVDLIIMRSRRRPVAASLLGSTAEKVCKTAPCPVLVTHPREREWVGLTTSEIDLHRVLIPYDNSRDADLAVNYGLSLAEMSQAQIHLLHVMSHRAAIEASSPANDQTATSDEIAAQRLRVLIPEEARLWCSVIPSVRCGDPAEEILAYAREHQIDLICMGASGNGFSLVKLFGSTADRVLRSAPCPPAHRDEFIGQSCLSDGLLPSRHFHVTAATNSGSAASNSLRRTLLTTPTSLKQRLIVFHVRAMSLSRPTEKRIKPSPIPIFCRSSSGISAEVLWPGALKRVLK